MAIVMQGTSPEIPVSGYGANGQVFSGSESTHIIAASSVSSDDVSAAVGKHIGNIIVNEAGNDSMKIP
jgi:hypothetical protein